MDKIRKDTLLTVNSGDIWKMEKWQKMVRKCHFFFLLLYMLL